VQTIVVYDGAPDDRPACPEGVDRWIETTGFRGAAHARNLGFSVASGPFVALLDDDDEWTPDHLGACVGYLNNHAEVDVVATSAVVHRADGAVRLSPRVLMKDGEHLLTYLFGPGALISRERRMMTPTLVFRRELTELPMREDFSQREDTWWLLNQTLEGHKLVQLDTRSVIVHEDEERFAPRRSMDTDIWWADQLESVQRHAGTAYLVNVAGRERARSGDVEAVLSLRKHLLRRGSARRWQRSVLLLEVLVAFIMGRLRTSPGERRAER